MWHFDFKDQAKKREMGKIMFGTVVILKKVNIKMKILLGLKNNVKIIFKCRALIKITAQVY